MGIGHEAERARKIKGEPANGAVARPVWQAPRMQTLSLAETRNGAHAVTDDSVGGQDPS